MSNNNNFNNDMMYEQPAFGYYYPPMFRYPCDEDCDSDSTMDKARQQQPGMLFTPPTDQVPGFQMEPTLANIAYTQAFLRTQIGKRVRVSFLIGTGMLMDRTGILEQVGVSYIVLRVPEANTSVMADMYSIKFVDIFEPAGMPGMGGPRV